MIFVNAHDVYRLSKGFGVEPERFLEICGAKYFDIGIKVKERLIDLVLKQKNNACIFLLKSGDTFRCIVKISNEGCANQYQFQIQDGTLNQMSDKLCSVELDTKGFEKWRAVSHLKVYEHEWKFYHDLALEWNRKH
jgi:hypothetical protein